MKSEPFVVSPETCAPALNVLGVKVTVLPPETPAGEILKHNPDGLFVSNGPGDPAAVEYAIEMRRFDEERTMAAGAGATAAAVAELAPGHQLVLESGELRGRPRRAWRGLSASSRTGGRASSASCPRRRGSRALAAPRRFRPTRNC